MKSDLEFLQEFEEIVNNLPVDSDSSDPFAHYVDKDEMMKGMVYGQPVMALCGKIWVPARDGSGFPVCPECAEVYDSFFNCEGDDSDG